MQYILIGLFALVCVIIKVMLNCSGDIVFSAVLNNGEPIQIIKKPESLSIREHYRTTVFNHNQYEVTVNNGKGYFTKTIEFYSDESKGKMLYSIYYIDEGAGPEYYFQRFNNSTFVLQNYCKSVNDKLLLNAD